MSARVLVPLVTLLVGGGLGFAACWFARPAPTPVAERPADGDEVVVEIRLKLPPGAIRPNDFRNSASSVQQGALVNTQNPLDMAIEGQGFFQVMLPNGETGYTRDGSFGVNPTGKVITRDGLLLTPEITVPQDAVQVSVGSDGTVSARRATENNVALVLGQLTLVRFVNPGWLRRDEHGWWVETAESGPPHIGTPGTEPFGLVRQGFRERQAELDAVMLTDLVRQVVQEQRPQVRVER